MIASPIKPINVHAEITGRIGSRHNEGHCSRAIYRRRDELATEGVTALGETVPDTAIGVELINAWLNNRLREDA